MIAVYKIIYLDECDRPRDVFEHIELVEASHLVPYVKKMVDDGRICEESLDEYYRKYSCIQTNSNAEELLELDGYTFEELFLD